MEVPSFSRKYPSHCLSQLLLGNGRAGQQNVLYGINVCHLMFWFWSFPPSADHQTDLSRLSGVYWAGKPFIVWIFRLLWMCQLPFLSDNYVSTATASKPICPANVAPDQSHNQPLAAILAMHKISSSMEEFKVRTNCHWCQNYFYGTEQKCFSIVLLSNTQIPTAILLSICLARAHICSFLFVSSCIFIFFSPPHR